MLSSDLVTASQSSLNFSAAFFTRKVRPIYLQYPVYAPGREPQGYAEWLKQRKPEVVWGVDPETGAVDDLAGYVVGGNLLRNRDLDRDRGPLTGNILDTGPPAERTYPFAEGEELERPGG